ncbi:unnamed protein product [Didymodactylos carnosus]|uniref:Uncharacterized protein n=1 Tax=Didymodactylos carnosus TaxID=1234261 RepID=A0A814JCP9_9BILA|nr:unnamed protein product [Didymodactylos carnosus]CAF1035041.1 unnamed protein product [Didymodactylos carnosus]CAF3742938.1 unnamed protein product [Didymodactylos carnosus]CAF3805694.1 unnamed protein product [Didymodactylos carnosus]
MRIREKEAKSKFGAEFRRFELDRAKNIRYDEFYKFLEELHFLQNIPFNITYLDKDGELLSINNDSIIEHILRVTPGESYQSTNATDSLRKRKKISDQIQSLIHADSSKRHNYNERSQQLNIELQPDFRLVSSIIDVEILPVTYRRVRLHRYKESKPLGFYIRDGVAVKMGTNGIENVPGVFISRLLSGGLAESTGLLSVGDEIIEVNGIEVAGKTLDQVTDMMVANSHNLIITVRPANDTYNLKRNTNVSNSKNSLKINSNQNVDMNNTNNNNTTYSTNQNSSLDAGGSDDDEVETHRHNHSSLHDTKIEQEQKPPSILKL